MTTSNEHNNAPAVPQGWTDADSDAARLALELECLLMDTKDLSVVSKWWGSANDALELHRQRLGATPATAPAQERCSTCGYLTSEREHLGCLRRAVKDLDIATGGPYDAQGAGLTDEEIEAIAKKHMSTVGDHWSNEEAIREIHAEDFARAIIAALRAKEDGHD